MSIDMYLEDSQRQGSSAWSIAQEEIAAYEAIEGHLAAFENSTDSLKGKAYDSARSYVTEVLHPLVRAGKELAQAVGQAVKQFPEAYTEQVASQSLKESDLESDIARLDSQIARVQDVLELMAQDSSEGSGQRQQLMGDIIGDMTQARQELQDKLDKLRAFHASSPALFSEIDGLRAKVEAGLAQVNHAWDAKQGIYVLPTDLSWAASFKAGKQKTTASAMSTAAKKAAEELKLSQEEKEAFVTMMETQYGFSNEEAGIMLNVYVGLVKEYDGDKNKANQQFFVYMASFVYTQSTTNAMMWGHTGGLMQADEVKKKLKALGIDANDIDTLERAILNQSTVTSLSGTTNEERLQELAVIYKLDVDNNRERLQSLLDQFYNKTDFAHTSATISAYYKDNGIFDTLFNENANAGYYGDLTLPGNISMNNGDYHADLDAVNLYNQLKGGKSLVGTMNSYFKQVESDDTYRAEQFVTNIGDGDYDKGLEKLQSQYYAYVYGNSGGYEPAAENPLFKDFIDSLKGKSDDLQVDGK